MTNEAFERIQEIIKEQQSINRDIDNYRCILGAINEGCKPDNHQNTLTILIPDYKAEHQYKYYMNHIDFAKFLERRVGELRGELAKLDAEVQSL